MNELRAGGAWLEKTNGERVSIRGTCSLGRSRNNELVLADEKVSRRHALVHAQGVGEFWLVDFGSVNGTFVNHRRVVQPVPLRDMDLIEIGGFRVFFRYPQMPVEEIRPSITSVVTAPDIKLCQCWLLIADIEGSSQLGELFTQEQLPVIIGQWFSRCKQIIDDHNGMINKFLGDGFFAYWMAERVAHDSILKCLQALKQLQSQAPPRFRLILHRGTVSVGGTTTMGEESLLGHDVNFAFRMEKLAGSLKAACFLSDAARKELYPQAPFERAGDYPLPGFKGSYEFFTY